MLDFFLFNICWFATAYGVSTGHPNIGPVIVILALLTHLFYSNSAAIEGVFAILVATTGYLLDSTLQHFEVLEFGGSSVFVFAPIWLFFQWMAFSLLFEHALTWLHDRIFLGAAMAGVGGPLSYYSADQLQVLQFMEPLAAGIVISSVTWVVVFPFFLLISRQIHQQDTC